MSGLFTLGERLGIFLTFEAGLLSTVSVASILCYAFYIRLRSRLDTWRRKDLRRSSDATSSLLFLNLMVADLIQGLGVTPNIKWMADGVISEGRLCTTQAVLKQIGIVGVALTSSAIAFHTFCVLVLHWKEPPQLPKYVIVGIWTLTALILGSANAVHRNEVYYGPTQFWCWITDEFKAEQIVTEYLWVWISGFSMIILYSIMFAVIHRWMNIAQGIHWYNQPHKGSLDVESDDDKKLEIRAIANSMLYFPAVYIVCVIPNSLARWLYFTDRHPPPLLTLFANTIYDLSGLCNLILFLLTRPTAVVGSPKDKTTLPIYRRDEHARNSTRKVSRLSEYDYGILSIDIESDGPKSGFELQSPSRSQHRPRSSYDLQGVSSLPSSPMRKHYLGASSIAGAGELLDDG